MAIIKRILHLFRSDNYDYIDTIEEENNQLKKKLKRNNKDIIAIINERDEIKDELLDVYRKRSDDLDKVLIFKEEYKKYYDIHKEQKKEIADLKNENRKKGEELEKLIETNRKKDKKIEDLIMALNSQKKKAQKRRVTV